MGEPRRKLDPKAVGVDTDIPARPPESLEELKALVSSGRIEFADRARQIGVYALRHPDQVAFLSIQEIARVTGASPASVHRFARKLGFKDYGALRRVFQKHISDPVRRSDD